jgi:tetratricopeptide (TPR) repeat protein
MILRLSTPAARGLLLLIAFVLAAAFAYSGVRNALAVHEAGLNTRGGLELATRLEPGNAENWYLLGRYWQYNLEDPNSEKAIQAYQKSLSIDAHSADTWSDLAMAYESEDNLPAARDAFMHAKSAYPLSPEVAWRFGNFLLRRGELDAAFAEIRHAVEIDPKRGAAAIALCARIDPNTNEVLDRVLPPSQQAYLNVISALANQQQPGEALLVWSRLMNLRPHLALTDSNDLIEALIHKNQMLEAAEVWNQAVYAAGISRPPDPPGSLVWDGGFESNIINAGFTWQYAPYVNGVQIGVDSKEKHSGNHSLRLTFNGLRNVDFQDVCQYIVVQPATAYRFSGWIQTRSLSTDEGVRFGLRAISDSGSSVSWTADVQGTQPWTQIELAWTSPPDVRQLRLCISRRPSAKFDSKIRGSAWIDDISLVPAPAEHALQ